MAWHGAAMRTNFCSAGANIDLKGKDMIDSS